MQRFGHGNFDEVRTVLSRRICRNLTYLQIVSPELQILIGVVARRRVSVPRPTAE